MDADLTRVAWIAFGLFVWFAFYMANHWFISGSIHNKSQLFAGQPHMALVNAYMVSQFALTPIGAWANWHLAGSLRTYLAFVYDGFRIFLAIGEGEKESS